MEMHWYFLVKAIQVLCYRAQEETVILFEGSFDEGTSNRMVLSLSRGEGNKNDKNETQNLFRHPYPLCVSH